MGCLATVIVLAATIDYVVVVVTVYCVLVSTVVVDKHVARLESAAQLRMEEALQQEVLRAHLHIGRHIGEGEVRSIVTSTQ